MRSSARFLTLVAAAAFGACARPDMHNVLMNEATSHSVEGRWDVAYERMGKVIANDEADPSTAPERLAEDYAILGAWAGMNCRFEDAERHMQRSYDYFVRAKSGNEYIASFELAELAFGLKRYPAAVARFKQALAERDDREKMDELDAMDLDDYAVALDETGDHADAVAIREQVLAWRTQHPGARWFGPMAYDRNCPDSSAKH